MSLKDNNNVIIEKKIENSPPDTTEYIKNIFTNKDKYIGKPASTLFNDLKIKIVSYNIEHDRMKCYGINAAFLSADDMNRRYNNGNNFIPYLTIEFVNPILRSDVEKALGESGGIWSKADQDYYGKQIVRDLN